MEGAIKPEHIQNAINHMAAIEKLKKLGDVWVGPDIQIESKLVIPPRPGTNSLEVATKANIVVNIRNFPSMKISKGLLSSLSWSVRSFLAQSGIEIIFSPHDTTDEMIDDLNEGIISVPIPVLIINHGMRAVELDGNVMRFFWANDASRLRGEDLRKVIGSELVIEGREGKDWSVEDAFYDDAEMRELNKDYAEGQRGVCIKLNLKKEKFYTPPSEDPLKIKSRKELSGVLRKVPFGIDIPFSIGETPKVKLSKDILAVINTGVGDNGKRHIFSPLIDPGFEGNIRTETMHGLDHIELFVYRK
jgi:hypothetical protein